MKTFTLHLAEEEMLMVKDYFILKYVNLFSEAQRCTDKRKKECLLDQKSSCARIVEKIERELLLSGT